MQGSCGAGSQGRRGAGAARGGKRLATCASELVSVTEFSHVSEYTDAREPSAARRETPAPSVDDCPVCFPTEMRVSKGVYVRRFVAQWSARYLPRPVPFHLSNTQRAPAWRAAGGAGGAGLRAGGAQTRSPGRE